MMAESGEEVGGGGMELKMSDNNRLVFGSCPC